MNEPQKNLPPKKTAAFDLPEARLAAQLGISRDVLRHLRQEELTEGLHFARLSKKLFYCEEAAEHLRKRLDLPPEELQRLLQSARPTKDEPPEPDEPPPPPRAIAERAGVLTLKVWRNFSSRQKDGSLKYNGILEAYKSGSDPELPENLLRVTCRSGENFVRHMEIPVRHLAGDVYECARPDPRWRGCW